ncbi:MAG: hypothetical protein NVS2B14_13310 [Chamaesiphon sp.]
MKARLVRSIFIAVAIFTNVWILETQPARATTSVNQYLASKYRELGLDYQRQERYKEAIATMKKSVELDPKNTMGRVNLGWTLHLAKENEPAARELLQAVYRDPFAPPAFNALGIVYLVSGNLVSGVIVHSWAVVLKPDNEIAYYNLSLAFDRLGLYGWAITTGSKAAILEPSNPHPLVAVAIAYWDSSQQPAAERTYRQALNLDSRYSDRTFLPHLEVAAFSANQIRTAEQILSALKR